MIRELGEEYVHRLRKAYKGRVSGGADLVMFWYEKARQKFEGDRVERVGLVATNSIRYGQNRKVLDALVEKNTIFEAWADLPWVNEGASVRVSLLCIERGNSGSTRSLDGEKVVGILTNLTASDSINGNCDITKAQPLDTNTKSCFIGTQKSGPFEINREQAEAWLLCPTNPNGRPNSDVLKPYVNGRALAGRLDDVWIVDFGVDTSEQDAAFYEKPFEYVRKNVKRAMRDKVRRENHQKYWWRFGETKSRLTKWNER